MRTNLDKRGMLTAVAILCTATLCAQQEDMSTLFDGPHVLSYIVAGLLIGVFVQIFRNRLFVYREREVNAQKRSKNAQLALVLQTCKVEVWTYHTTSQTFRRLAKDGMTEGNYTPLEFSNLFNRDDFDNLSRTISDICEGNKQQATIGLRSRKSADDQQEKQYEVSLKVLKKDGQGRPRLLLGMQRDTTDDVQKKAQVTQMLMQFHTLFNQSLIDMVSYDENGVMNDINEKACETFHIADRNAILAKAPRVEDNPGYNAAVQSHTENIHFTAILDTTDLADFTQDQLTNSEGKLYYELKLNRLHDEQGRMTGVFAAGRNVSEMVESRHHQQRAMQELQQTTQRIQSYVNNINYALQVSKVRLTNYYPQTHTLEISDNLNSTQYRLTQMRCIDLVHPDHRRDAKRMLRQMDRLLDVKFSCTLHTILRDSQGRGIWLAFNVLPVYDADGRVHHYFGMCRNETEMVETEQLLKKETQKAQETELLKDSFLMNMSYEIRTPLNAVLGFAELFNQEHDAEDEPVFVEQIKYNSNKLLALVNDALFLSRLDARMQEFKPAPIDFAIMFEGRCQIGWSNDLKPDVKTIVENPYNHLVIDIDEESLSQVIQRLCASAAFHTKTGFIRAKYEYRRGELNITIEDTGGGLDKDSLAHVFDRFVNSDNVEHYGTGLGMPIVKELVEQMGGFIDITSEVGKGTSAWITIPCELREMDKKIEITV